MSLAMTIYRLLVSGVKTQKGDCNMKKVVLSMLVMFCFLISLEVLAKSIKTSDNSDFYNNLNCQANIKLQQLRSHELQQLLDADQLDRKNVTKVKEVVRRDLKRRKRVGEIFAEGCINSAVDYLNAALIYQHGITSDHYYQAYLWAKKAMAVGGPVEKINAKSLIALTIDRYLISIGKKQLFGSQYSKPENDSCYCMEPVESGFPDKLRLEYTNISLQKRYELLKSFFNKGSNCPVRECSKILAHTPKGNVPGLW